MSCARRRRWAFVIAAAAVLSINAGAHALQCAAGTIKFHDDGGIQRCVIDAHHRIYSAKNQPIDCIAGHAVWLYPDGKLESCQISENHVVLGMPCMGPARIELDETGVLRDCQRK